MKVTTKRIVFVELEEEEARKLAAALRDILSAARSEQLISGSSEQQISKFVTELTYAPR